MCLKSGLMMMFIINMFACHFQKPVFNVIDQDGNKITDEEILDYIQKVYILELSGGYFSDSLHILT